MNYLNIFFINPPRGGSNRMLRIISINPIHSNLQISASKHRTGRRNNRKGERQQNSSPLRITKLYSREIEKQRAPFATENCKEIPKKTKNYCEIQINENNNPTRHRELEQIIDTSKRNIYIYIGKQRAPLSTNKNPNKTKKCRKSLQSPAKLECYPRRYHKLEQITKNKQNDIITSTSRNRELHYLGKENPKISRKKNPK